MKHFDSNYIVYSDGRVYSVRRNMFLKPQPTTKGYKQVKIYGKWYSVHRLVAKVFIPNQNNLPQVNHLNKDKTDNRVENLEWCDNRHNKSHSFGFNNPGITKRGKKYYVRIGHNKKYYYLGRYDTVEKANLVYTNFLAQL